MSVSDDWESRMLAYIAPRMPETEEQEAALAAAVAAQIAYEGEVALALGSFGAVDGVSAVSNGDVSLTFAKPRRARLTPDSIAPSARAALCNAGLLRGYMPEARKLP